MGEALLLLSDLMCIIHNSIADLRIKLKNQSTSVSMLKHLSVAFYARIKFIIF